MGIDITRIEALRERVMKTACSCESINERLDTLGATEEGVCCARCCDCHWDKLIENIQWNEGI